LARAGCPDDIAANVVYLASDEANYVTGAEFTIDAGLTAQ
jgi:NAD(P)-dependent dehydrogenase (short-subunit alcohol dehydrogenase family)